MRNKWYVIAIAAPALLLLYWAINLALADNMAIALVPGLLAGALLFGAYRVAQAPSFAPAAQSQWGGARTPGVMRWLKDHQDAPPPRLQPRRTPPCPARSTEPGGHTLGHPEVLRRILPRT